MYNPIGLNVVRQSLAWMGAPRPRIKTSSQHIISETGVVMKQITLNFDGPRLLYWVFENDPLSDIGISDEAQITAALQSCFCDDIKIAGVERWGSMSIGVTALVTLTAKD